MRHDRMGEEPSAAASPWKDEVARGTAIPWKERDVGGTAIPWKESDVGGTAIPRKERGARGGTASPRKERDARCMVLLLAAAFLLVGCGSKAKYELREAAIAQIDAGEYATAIDSLNQALEKSDGKVGEFELDVLRYRAEAEYGLKDYAAAAGTYGILWEVDGRKPEYLSRWCAMLVCSGQLDEALVKYRDLYGEQPESDDTVEVLLALGSALLGEGRDSEAVELFQQAVDDGVQNGEIYNWLALNELQFEEYDQALAYLDKGLALGDGAREKLLYNQAVVYEKKLDFASALAVLESYVREFDPRDDVEREIAFLRTRVE